MYRKYPETADQTHQPGYSQNGSSVRRRNGAMHTSTYTALMA